MITILGPTATGKTSIAAHLAQRIGGEVISADSRQVYRGMTIGTGKDLGDYMGVPYHLIDICEAGEHYNVFRFQQDFMRAKADIESRGKTTVLCGGTGLYIESVLRGYRLDTKHPKEASAMEPVASTVIGVTVPRDVRRERISERLRARLDEGMVDEVRGLLDSGLTPEQLIYYGLEYKFLTSYIIGSLGYDEMVRLLEIAIHQFAKRQMTYFRGMERRGIHIDWVDGTLPMEEKTDIICKIHAGA